MLPLRCEACGDHISTVEQGWVEWIDRLENGHRVARRVRIVHVTRACRYRSDVLQPGEGVGDRALGDFFGDNGMSLLFEKISEGQFSQDIVCELLKRLYVADYEKWIWNHKLHAGRIYWNGDAAWR